MSNVELLPFHPHLSAVAFTDKDEPNNIAWCTGSPGKLNDISPLYTFDTLRAYATEAVLQGPAIKMEIALDHLRHMSESAALKEDAREGFKMALSVIGPMFADYVSPECAAAIRSQSKEQWGESLISNPAYKQEQHERNRTARDMLDSLAIRSRSKE